MGETSLLQKVITVSRENPTGRPFLRLCLAGAAVAAVTAGLALPAYAEALVDTSDSPQIPAGQVVDGSAYLAGNTITVAGTVQGDLYCGANTVTITGVVEGDVLCGANSLTLSGQVGGDVRLGGNTVTINGSTAGAATIGASSIVLAPESSIGTDLVVGGAQVDLAGTVGRDVRAGAERATISGTVGRDVDGEMSRLTVAEGAQVAGHLHYVSDTDATIAPGSVQGDVQRTPPPPQETFQRGPTFATWVAVTLFWIVGFVVMSLFVALVLPRYVRTTASRTWSDLGMALLVGFLTFLAAGPAALLLLVTGIGALAALLLWSALGVAMMIGSVLAAHAIGRAVLSHRERNVVGTTVLGAALLAVVGAVPVLGPIVVFLAACAGLGMIVRGLRSQHERRPMTGPSPYPAPAPAPYPGPAGAPAYQPATPPPTYVAGPHAPEAPAPTQEMPPTDESPRDETPRTE